MLKYKRTSVSLAAILVLSLVSLFVSYVQAAEITNRSVAISNSKPNEAADQLISFTYVSSDPVGSVVFEYCENTAVLDTACSPPAGFDASSASLDLQLGETGFSIHPNTTANRVVLTRPPVAVTPGSGQYLLGNVVNVNTPNKTVYLRTYIHGSDDGTGGYVDAGAMAFSTSATVETTAYVPPYLLFCVGVTVSLDCTTTEGNFINLGELSSQFASVATSQYSGATNDPTGYTVSVFGPTISSGNNIIPSLTSPQPSNPGTSQFGMNLRDNSSPDVGIDPIGPGTASAEAQYNLANNFKYQNGDLISSVASSSSYDRFTISYLVNVNQNQQPGIYNSTFTYVAVASF